MSSEIINAPGEVTNPDAVGAVGGEVLPASTPEYAPAAQVFVEDVAGKGTGNREQGIEEKGERKKEKGGAPEPETDTLPSASADLSQQAYDLMVQFVSRDPRFEVNNNIRQILAEVQHLRAEASNALAPITDLAVIRETVQHIWTRLQNEGTGNREQGTEESGAVATALLAAPSFAPAAPSPAAPSLELINETRTLVRSVNEEVNAVRNSAIQLTNQMRIAMDVTTRCLREMDKTARKYEQTLGERSGEQGETGALLDELRSLRDMLADGFENARLEPIAPEPGDAFRYNEHRAENGFAASGKIKRTLFAGFRWTQPTPPVVLLPAIVETE